MTVGEPSPEVYPASAGAGAGMDGGTILFAAFVVFIFSPVIFGTLYPIATGAALVASFATQGFLRVAAPGTAPDSRLPFAMLAALVVFWPLSRLDHRLAATVPPYRMARHVARVALFAGFCTLMSLNPSRGLPRSPIELRMVLANPFALPLFAAIAILTHLFLVRAKRTRAMWDTALEFFRLRPRNLR
jgi:hypothetical protein